MILFYVVTGLLAVLVCTRVVLPLDAPLWMRLLICVAVLGFGGATYVLRKFFSVLSTPEVPGPVLMLVGWGVGMVLIAAVLALVLDVLGLVSLVFSRETGRWLLGASGLRASIGIVAATAAAIAVWQAVRVPDVRRVEISLQQLAPQLDGFRIVQLTDLHASRLLDRDWVQAVVDKTNALNPDLILITGDLVDGELRLREPTVEPLKALRAKHGVFGVPGNHEYYSRYQPWVDHFERLGIRMLINRHELIPQQPEAAGAQFVLAGVPDTAAWSYGLTLPHVGRALRGAPAGMPVVLMAHRPAGAEQHAQLGVDLQLSGHTHGGQVLLMHWLVKRANEGRESRLYQVNGMQLYVSHGAGLWAGFPLRLGRWSEITEFTLRSPRA